MRKCSGSAGFALESLAVCRGCQRLHGDVTVQFVVVREPDGAHRARGPAARGDGSGPRSARPASRRIIVLRGATPSDDRRGARACPRPRPAAACRRCRHRRGARPRARGGCGLARRPAAVSELGNGWACRAGRRTRPESLRVVGQSAAGRPAGRPLEAGEAIAISTGAVVPDGADAVVPVEQSEEHAGELRVGRIAHGVNVRPRGGDVARRRPRRRRRRATRAGPGRRARGLRHCRGALCPPAACRRRPDRHRAAPPRRAAWARRDLRVELAAARRAAPIGGRRAASSSTRLRTTPRRRAPCLSERSPPTSCSHPAVCRSARTTSCAMPSPPSERARCSGVSP